MTRYTYIAKTGALLILDIGMTVILAYTPHDLSVLRMAVSVVVLLCMIATIAMAIRAVLEDF